MRLCFKSNQIISLVSLSLISTSSAYTSQALTAIQPQQVHTILSGTLEKDSPFWSEGLFTGGDQSMDQAVIKNIRYSIHRGYERLVFDLSTTQNGEIAAIPRPPYYQFFLDPRLKRLTFTFWGDPKLHFDPKLLHEMTKKSRLISRLSLLPKLEDDLWTFGLNLKKGVEVKVFELDNPVRIVVDIRQIKG